MRQENFLANVKREHPLPQQPETSTNAASGLLDAACCASSFPLGTSRTLAYDIIRPFVYIVDDDWASKPYMKKLFWRFGYQQKQWGRIRKIVLKHNPSQLKPIHPDRSFAARCSRLLKIPLWRLILRDLLEDRVSKQYSSPSSNE